ncbi:HEPN domain-containing protein [Phocaeicola paurosaccharolyticus]|uniref:HEPN domain-containing protein n=1 Tax=Phocaeicola paurosaccharolyticus TaxID=732242 RepID=UPI00046AC387|nr:HEPN domain-containing protein [Phocaeicola paurosaccharolyticus]
MAKKFYVKGGILVNTPYFNSNDVGCFYTKQPKDTEIMETNTTIEGIPCLLIDNENPQSIFNEYYAKDFFTSYYSGAEFYYKSYREAYNDYISRITDIKEIIQIENLNDKQKMIVNRLSYLNIVASIETFVCDTLLTKITEKEDLFMDYFNTIEPKRKEEMKNLLDNGQIGKWEQSVIDYVIKTSYCNIDTIKNMYKDVFNVLIVNTNGVMNKIILNRNKLAHRNGRNKDGSYINISNQELETLINNSKNFVDQILSKIEAVN